MKNRARPWPQFRLHTCSLLPRLICFRSIVHNNTTRQVTPMAVVMATRAALGPTSTATERTPERNLGGGRCSCACSPRLGGSRLGACVLERDHEKCMHAYCNMVAELCCALLAHGLLMLLPLLILLMSLLLIVMLLAAAGIAAVVGVTCIDSAAAAAAACLYRLCDAAVHACCCNCNTCSFMFCITGLTLV
jgi:hypothetical protein